LKPILFPSFILLLLVSCKKEIDKLPPITQSGANTFGCLLNANAWVPGGSVDLFSNTYPTSGGFFGDSINTISIYVSAYNGRDEIHIYLKHPAEVKTYFLNKNTLTYPYAVYPEASYGEYRKTDQFGNEELYTTDSIHTGIVTVTRSDITNSIVSGIFQMQLYQQSTGKTINITDGRFDYKTHI